MINLVFHHIEICKSKLTNEVAVKGEVTNNTQKSYTAVGVRVVLFKNNVTVANVVFTINGVAAGATRAFEKTIEKLDYQQIGRDVNRYDIYTESAF